MRNKIDYGIDLGTTNSAIARMENGVPIIRKSDTLKDTVPSCVHFNKRKDILVGDTAFNVMKNDNTRALKTFEAGKTNTFIEFKRTMGTTHLYESSNMAKQFTSEELSAEVLKKLKSLIQDENIYSIVITVPAKFLNPQNEATMDAAKLAGFKNVQLLQEPVAAATAYGLTAKNKDSFWCVFDFGGGTFDAALVKSDEGILSVKDTDGDNWLGGKNIDKAIVDQLIIPYLERTYSIESILADTTKKEILRNAVKTFAEEAKIQLSFKDSHNILSNLGDLPFEDDNGEEPEIDVTITQKELEEVVAPIFQKAIDITKELLKRNNLKGADLGALILVGGPTYSPILRRMLREQITEKVDTSVDPMTVVAKGAALFASTISVSEELKEESRDRTKLQLDVKYEATTVEIEEMINIKVLREKTEGSLPDKIYVEVVRSDGAWSSGKKQIGEKGTILEVVLNEGQSNSFDINVYDDSGNRLECQPQQFTILQGIGGLDGMQVLPYHIGISKYFQAEKKDLFEPVKGLEKSKKVPATGVRNGLKTRTSIRPGMATDIISIPVYQGDYNAKGTNPVLNNLITEVIISGESIPSYLPENSIVNITIKVDKSQIMHFSAEFPAIDHTEELKIQIKQTEPPTEEFLRDEMTNAKKSAEDLGANEIVEELRELEAQLEYEKGSADGKMNILDSLRKELLKLEMLIKITEYPKAEKSLNEKFAELEDFYYKYKDNGAGGKLNMNMVKEKLEDYRLKVADVKKGKNTIAAKELYREIKFTLFDLNNIINDNQEYIQYLFYYEKYFNAYHWKDSNSAKLLMDEGLGMVMKDNKSEIPKIVIKLIELLPENEQLKKTLG